MEQHAPKIVFLTSPNNPDGSVVSDEELAAVLALPVLVVLDEAYIEFATDLPSRIKWVQAHDNLVVLRTFSKCAALAGMRVGYGAFPKPLIEYLWRAKQPYNVSVAAEVRAPRAARPACQLRHAAACAVAAGHSCVAFGARSLCKRPTPRRCAARCTHGQPLLQSNRCSKPTADRPRPPACARAQGCRVRRADQQGLP